MATVAAEVQVGLLGDVHGLDADACRTSVDVGEAAVRNAESQDVRDRPVSGPESVDFRRNRPVVRRLSQQITASAVSRGG